jgi:hypothetical protein
MRDDGVTVLGFAGLWQQASAEGKHCEDNSKDEFQF